MAKECVVCGKKPVTGNLVSHSNRKARTRWLPNLQNVKAVINGVTKRVKVCTKCLKSNKVDRA